MAVGSSCFTAGIICRSRWAQDTGRMRGSVPVVPAPDANQPARPVGRPADVEDPSGFSEVKDVHKGSVKSAKSVRLGDLDFSSEESEDESCQRLLRKLYAMKATWTLVTLVVIVLCAALTGPVLCKDSVKCKEYHLRDQDLRFYSALVSAALASVLLQEAASALLTLQAAKKAVHLIPDVADSLIPSTLLCITFVVLIVENLVFVIGETPWFAHAAILDRDDLDQQPVYSVFYAEWVINVPILLILAGSISLGRPPSEVGEPLLITNVYIVLAWVAHFIPNVPLRYMVVSVFRLTWQAFFSFGIGSVWISYWLLMVDSPRFNKPPGVVPHVFPRFMANVQLGSALAKAASRRPGLAASTALFHLDLLPEKFLKV